MILSPNAATVYADGPSSDPSQPSKALIRSLLTQYEQAIEAYSSGAGSIAKSTRALLYADLTHAADVMAWVYADTTAAYNGIYRKSGSSGAGSWSKVLPLPYAFVVAQDSGAGTANAISLSSAIPAADGLVFCFSLFEGTTAGSATVSINGGTPLVLKTNRGANATALTAGMDIWFRVRTSDNTARMLNDQDVSALVAQAEDAEAGAVAAAAVASAAVDEVSGLVAGVTNVFSSISSAAAYSPVVAPGFLQLSGYYSSGDTGRNATYRLVASAPSHDGKFSITLSDGVTVKWYELSDGNPNARMFGAKGDGTTDDTAALNAFLAFAIKGTIPTGSYKVTAPLNFRTNHNISGDGPSTVIFWGGANTSTSMIVVNGINNVTISNLTFTVNRASYGSVSAISVTTCVTINIKDCKIDGAGDHPIFISGCNRVNIDNVTLTGGWTNSGIQMNSCVDCEVLKSRIFANSLGTYGIQIMDGSRNRVTRCYIEKTPDSYFGIHAFGCDYVTLSDNYILNTRREALAVGGACVGAVISRNEMLWTENLGTGDFGMSVAGGNGSQVTGDMLIDSNVIVNAALDGIGIAGFTSRITVSNNVIRDSGYANASGFRAGIKVYGWQPGAFATDTFIHGNHVNKVSSPGLTNLVYEAAELGSVARTIVTGNKSINTSTSSPLTNSLTGTGSVASNNT